MTIIHKSPIEICNPWVPTNVKNEERNALLCQLAFASMNLENSDSSMQRNATPKTKVTRNQKIDCFFCSFWTARVAKAHVKLLVSNRSVSANADGNSKSSRPEGPPKVLLRKTIKVAQSTVKITRSVIKYTQNP